MKTALMLRVGGLGDCVTLIPVAKQLQKQGYEVDYFVGSPTGNLSILFTKLPYFRSVKAVGRVNGIDCVEMENKDFVSVEILKDGYDEVFDFSVEDNRAGLNKVSGWRTSINSNYINWVDMFLGWENIDWTKITDEDKRPEFSYPDSKYLEWVKETPVGEKITRTHRVVGIQLQASSLTRSWYRASDLPKMLHEKYPNDVILIYADNRWLALTEYGKVEVLFPEDYDPICCSAALVANMDVFISADSGMSHIAEATATPTIGIYTTVPSWTRVKYYRYAYPIDADVACHPCFNLDIFCPLERKKADEALTERERDIVVGGDAGANIMEFAKKYQTVPRAINEEYEAIKRKREAMSAVEPACVHSITPEIIMNYVEKILCSPTVIQQLSLVETLIPSDSRSAT
jgi:ADP-heptose:LPS heptosyltransferase